MKFGLKAENLKLEELAGQMIVAGFEGTSLPESIRKMLENGRISGVILFTRNYEAPAQLKELCDSVIAAARPGPVKPFIMVDHEGGKVQRLKTGFTVWPPMRNLGETGSEDVASELGTAFAGELAPFGINVNLAPVVDVESEPTNHIQDRSLGKDPELVARLSSAFIKAMQSGGLGACAKHFPAYGCAPGDSHFELPKVSEGLDVIEKRDLVPFRAAVEADVGFIMTAHAIFEKIDPYYPGTLSEKIVSGMLKGELKFKGVVVSDDVEMGAISKNYPFEDAIYMSVKAGCDLLLVCHKLELVERAFETIIKAAEHSALVPDRLYDAVERVLAAKKRFLYNAEDSGPLPDSAMLQKHAELARRIEKG